MCKQWILRETGSHLTKNLRWTASGIKADLIKRLQIHTPYQSHVQTMDTERNRITSYEKPTMDGKWFTHTKTVVHAADLTNVATKTYSNLNKIRFEDTKTADAAKVTNATARNSMDRNLIRFEDTKMTASVTEGTNTTAEDKTVASTEETRTLVNMNMFQFGDTKTTADAAEATNAAAKSSTNINVNRFEDTKTAAGVTEVTNTTAEDKTVASTTEAMNGETKTSVNMNMFQFGDTKTPAGAAEVTNAAAKSSTNINVFRFEDTKTAADTIETTNTTAEAKAVANATKETNAAVRNFVGDISKGYVGTFQFGKAKIVASAAEATNATRNFTDVNINRFEGTKMAAGVTEEINPKYFVDVHMIWREAELYRREKELAEQELMLARKEIEMLRQALIDMATRPQKICCCFERMSLKDENGESVSVSRQDKCNFLAKEGMCLGIP
ncbi:hypothetical protein ALC57_09001 [Trachymyrmex cornetzi]|uniref:Uncharacterized protein n=1 Tax=Trachymyrmex cornetzi TaxID=471704 RepID=A0A151J660_9HYME|nr:hypothetical protein ALC57_09001 [Trachymyrmex cornetzi]